MKKSILSLALAGFTVLLGIQSPAMAGDQINIVGGYLVYASAGRWVPFRWGDGSNMKAKSFGATSTQKGTPFIVAIGGDGVLLFRIGPASRDFLNRQADAFTWNPNEKDRRMKAQRVVGVSPLSGDAVRVSVIAGNGSQCTLDANISDIYRSNASWWDCL